MTEYVQGKDLAHFLEDRMLQDAISYRLQVIGEAAYKVSDQTKTVELFIDRFKISGLRHRIVHDYRNIDMETLWRITQKYVPPLAERLEVLAKGYGWV